MNLNFYRIQIICLGMVCALLAGCASSPTYVSTAPPLLPKWEDRYWQGGSSVGSYRAGGRPLTRLTADHARHAPMAPYRELR